MRSNQISVQELAHLLKNPNHVYLLDVRSAEERAILHLGGEWIPLPQLNERLSELPQDKCIVIYCRSGYRSQLAVEMLEQLGWAQVKNLTGGILAWQSYQAPSEGIVNVCEKEKS